MRRAKASTRPADLGRAIRANLEADAVLDSAAKAVERALGPCKVCIWLWRPGEEPRRVLSRGDPKGDPLDLEPPDALRKAAERGRPWRMQTAYGLAYSTLIVAPQSGPLAILCVAKKEMHRRSTAVVDEIAMETGYALETANLYAKAIEQRDKSAAILDRVGDAVFVTDAVGRAHEWNRVAEWHLDLPPSAAAGTCSSLLGLRDDDGPLDCSKGCALLARVKDNGEGVGVWRSRPDGRKQPLLATAAPLSDDGDIYEVVHSLRDVTRLKEAEEAKNLFLATASHELRTPLTVIQGFAQLMQQIPEGPAGGWSTAVDAIARRSQQLDSIVERLLLSSRIEAEHNELRCVPTDIGAILRDEVAVNAQARERDISYVSEFLPEAMIDPTATVTIIQHLLENAVKYSPEGGPIEVRGWTDGRTIRVSVGDKGVGMAPDQVSHCFEKFWQAESSDVRRFGGTGIGLFIVKSLCVAMGGAIEVSSSQGHGSTFTFTLPRAGEAAEKPAAVSVSLTAEPAPPTRNGRISERSTIQEFMRQIGVPARGGR